MYVFYRVFWSSFQIKFFAGLHCYEFNFWFLVAFTYIFSTPPFALSLIVSAKIIAFFAGLIKIHLIFFLKCYRNADVVHGCSIYYINTQLHMLMKPNAKSNVWLDQTANHVWYVCQSHAWVGKNLCMQSYLG